MRQREYQFIFFLNISHSFYSETELGKKHSHTWELEVSMHPKDNELVRFKEAEQVVSEYLERFQDKYLNGIAPFHRMNPSIENFLDHVAGEIDACMRENDWVVKKLRISENPTRTYMIDRQRMDEVREQGVVSVNDIAAPEVAEAAATAEMTEPQSGKADRKDADIVTQKNETRMNETKEEEQEVQIASRLVVDTEELRVKTQTAGNTTRIVITIP